MGIKQSKTEADINRIMELIDTANFDEAGFVGQTREEFLNASVTIQRNQNLKWWNLQTSKQRKQWKKLAARYWRAFELNV